MENYTIVMQEKEVKVYKPERRFIGMFKYAGSHWAFCLPLKSMYLETLEEVKTSLDQMRKLNETKGWNCEYQIAEFPQPKERFIGEEQFLGMKIVDTGNGDGVTLVDKNGSVGNFGESWDNARLYAVRWFMLQRPDTFAKAIIYRLMGMGGSHLEYYLLTSACKLEGIEIPESVTASKCCNAMIEFNNQKV